MTARRVAYLCTRIQSRRRGSAAITIVHAERSMNMLRLGVGIAAVIVGVLRIYVTIEARAATGSISVFGIVVGLFFVVLGAWFATTAKRAR